jgi:hypothetical protein
MFQNLGYNAAIQHLGLDKTAGIFGRAAKGMLPGADDAARAAGAMPDVIRMPKAPAGAAGGMDDFMSGFNPSGPANPGQETMDAFKRIRAAKPQPQTKYTKPGAGTAKAKQTRTRPPQNLNTPQAAATADDLVPPGGMPPVAPTGYQGFGSGALSWAKNNPYASMGITGIGGLGVGTAMGAGGQPQQPQRY